MVCLVIFLLSVCTGWLSAQAPQPRLTWLTDDSRLTLSDEVADVQVDSEGQVWIVTFSEVVCYDGHRFRKIHTGNVNHDAFLRFYDSEHTGPYITDFLGSIFFIESDSLVAYEGNDALRNHFTLSRIVLGTRFVDSETLIASQISSGLIKLKNGRLVDEEMPRSAQSGHFGLWMQENEAPIIVLGDPVKVISHHKRNFNETGLTLFNDKKEIIDQRKYLRMGSVHSPPVVTTLPGGTYLFSNGKGNLLEVSKEKILREIPFDGAIVNLFCDSKNNLWVSTRFNGVHLYPGADLSGVGKQVLFKGEKFIISAEDHEGGIWGYSEEKGVFKIEQPYLRYFLPNKESAIGQQIYAMKIADGKLLFSTRKGVRQLDWQTQALDTFPELPEVGGKVSENCAYGIEYDPFKDRIWIAQRCHISYFENDSWNQVRLEGFFNSGDRTYLSGQPHQDKFSLSGMHYDWHINFQDTLEKERRSIAKGHHLYRSLKLGDSLLLDADNGIYILHQDHVSFLPDRFPELEGRITDWATFGNDLWVSTSGNGVFLLKGQALTPISYQGQKIIEAKIVVQNDSTLWLFSRQGSFMLDPNSSRLEQSQDIKVFKPLPQLAMSCMENNDSLLFVGTTKAGFYTTSFEDLKKNPLCYPRLRFEKLTVGGVEQEVSQSVIEAHYSKNSFQLWFNGISYEDWGVKYRYRLINFEKEWVYSDENYVQYTNLEPGEYRFEIQAAKGDQVWSPVQAISMVITPPFWNTWWFYILSFVMISGFTFWMIQLRFRVLNREKMLIISRLSSEQRALRAKMDPHFVFNVISSAQYLILKEKKEKGRSLPAVVFPYDAHCTGSVQPEIHFVGKRSLFPEAVH